MINQPFFVVPRYYREIVKRGAVYHENPLRLRPLVTGPLVHDARIAALCLAHGVTELWTLNRDFSRFPALKTRNPLG
jgi:predicted nucleic acid-binding protein